MIPLQMPDSPHATLKHKNTLENDWVNLLRVKTSIYIEIGTKTPASPKTLLCLSTHLAYPLHTSSAWRCEAAISSMELPSGWVQLADGPNGSLLQATQHFKAGEPIDSRIVNEMPLHSPDPAGLATLLLQLQPTHPCLTSHRGCFALRGWEQLQVLLGNPMLKLCRIRLREAETMASGYGLDIDACERALCAVHSRALAVPSGALSAAQDAARGLFILHQSTGI